MNTKRIVLVLAALAASLAATFLFCRRHDAGSASDEAAGQPASQRVPAFPVSTGAVVRALPPSALGARAATGKRPPAVPSLKGVMTVLDAANASLDARLAALATLGKSLPEADMDALFGFLDRRDAEDVLPPERLNALKNDVANVLRAQSKFPDVLPWRLAAMWRDSAHDEVWRDYCIQHAGAAWPRIAAQAARDEVRSLLWTAAADPAAPGSGTALISLRNLASSGSEDKAKVAVRASALAASGAAPEGVRVTALQIAAEFGHSDTAALSRSLLSDRSQPVHLRMSAAAALGTVGDSSDLPALKALASTSDPRLRAAASSAVRRLSDKPIIQ